MMKTQYERLTEAEEKIEQLINDMNILWEQVDRDKGCACRGQGCGPTYKQEKETS